MPQPKTTPRPYKIPQSVLVLIHTAALDVLLIPRADIEAQFWQSVTRSKDSEGGALIGAVIVQGFLNHSDQPTKFMASKMERQFQERCGATICHDIKDRIAAHQLSSCNECVQQAVEILESSPKL